jgi:peptide-methionine (R)-S-oxide reductase
MTRRELIGMASVGAIVVAIGGTAALTMLSRPPEGPEGTYPVHHSDDEWRKLLSPAAYQTLRKGATETAGTSPLLGEHRPGIFDCAGCDKPLFDSKTKFESGTGWPSFWDVLPGAIVKRADNALGMSRTEVRCATCGGHLGHVFDDGPKPSGLRYCMNGVALKFRVANA